VGAGLAGFAGVVGGTALSLAPGEDVRYLLASLVVVIVGGMGSIPGAVLGGYILGLTEVFSIATTGTSSYRDAIAFVLLFLILVVRPAGLLGARRVREA
ncbi:MAG: ABC transporter permease subunit, partial [Thermomicrobiales bacterium]